MSYPDISAVILDASFDDLVPLALKVMPDSWSEYSPQTYPCREGGLGLGAVLTGDGSLFHGWGVGLPVVEKQEDSLGASVFSLHEQWGPLCWARVLSLLSLHFYLTLGGLVTRTVRQHLNLNNAEQLCR